MQDVRTQDGWLLRSFEIAENVDVSGAPHWRAEVWNGTECMAFVVAPTERAARRRALKAARERRLP